MERKIILLFIVGMFLLTLVSSVPQQPAVINEAGIDINFPLISPIEQNKDFLFHFHAKNSSNGVFLTDSDITCSFHLSSSNGTHLVEMDHDVVLDANLIDWDILVTGANFSRIGEYSWLFNCNSTAQQIGGSVKQSIEVTYSGKELSTSNSVMYIPLFLVLFFLFGVTFFGIGLLPDDNTKDSEDNVMKISYLKYLRTSLWLALWGFLMGILFISSNLALAYLPDSLMHSFFFALFKFMLAITPGVIIVIFFWILTKILTDKELKKFMRRGLVGNNKI